MDKKDYKAYQKKHKQTVVCKKCERFSEKPKRVCKPELTQNLLNQSGY
jgi:predicted metal-binding protein